MKNTVYIVNRGCQRRALDASKLKRCFELNNYNIVTNPSIADIIILTTCGFFPPRVERSIKAIRELKKYDGELIVLGCLPAIIPEEIKKEFSGQVFAPKDYRKMNKFFPNVKYEDVSDGNFLYSDICGHRKGGNNFRDLTYKIRFSAEKIKKYIILIKEKGIKQANIEAIKSLKRNKKGYLRIAHGCLGNCSYCVIRYATGRLKSKQVNVVLEEYDNLLFNEGCRHFHFSGEDTGAYGLDIGSSLPELFLKLSEVDSDFYTTWYIETLNPQWLIRYKKEFLNFIKRKKIIAFEIDVQTGSKRILNLMKRSCDILEVQKTLQYIKKIEPDFLVYIQIMVGFPSESDEDFKETFDFIKKTKPNGLTVFKYGDMPRTVSSELKDKISEEIKENRLNAINELRKQQGLAPSP